MGASPPAGDATTSTDTTLMPSAWVSPARCMLSTMAVVFMAPSAMAA